MDLSKFSKIAYIGPEGSFSEMAKDEFCKKHGIIIPSVALSTVKEVVDFVNDNPDSLGVLPVENSIDGTLRAPIDTLIETPNPYIRILSELTMPIEYCLLSKTTEFYSITGIIATPRLMEKCNAFIKSELPRNLNIVEGATMSDCAKNLSNYNLTYASIGNRKTADTFRLNVLKSNINDDKTNQTKYILLGNAETEATGNDKTVMAFATEHAPGALLKILNVFLENDINLTYIASRPAKHDLNEYFFVISFDGHINDENISRVIEQVSPKTMFLRVFGSFEKNTVVSFDENMV